MYIYVNVEMNDGNFEVKRVEINDVELVKMIDRYFEVKGIEIKEFGII